MVNHDTIAPVTPGKERRERDGEIADLRWHWGSAYKITSRNAMFRAVRRDDVSAVTALTAESLRTEIRADYQARPVPRSLRADPPPDVG